MNIKLPVTEAVEKHALHFVELLLQKGFEITTIKHGEKEVNSDIGKLLVAQQFKAGRWIFTVDESPNLHISTDENFIDQGGEYFTVGEFMAVPTYQELQQRTIH